MSPPATNRSGDSPHEGKTREAYYTYVLRSLSTKRFYIGHAADVSKRLAEHNNGRIVSTRNRGPWELIYQEEYSSRAAANRRERQIKSMKNHAWIAKLAGASR